MSAIWPLQRSPRCRCSHPRADHGTDRKNRARCYGSTVCACTEFRDPELAACQKRHPAGKALPKTGDSA